MSSSSSSSRSLSFLFPAPVSLPIFFSFVDMDGVWIMMGMQRDMYTFVDDVI